MASDAVQRKLKGVEFVVGGRVQRWAVLIDLKWHRALREDFYDAAVTVARMIEGLVRQPRPHGAMR